MTCHCDQSMKSSVTPKNYIHTTLWFQVASPNFPENWIFFNPGTWQMSLLTRRYLAPRGNRCSQVISCGLSGFLLSSTSTINSHDELCQLSHVYQCEQGKSIHCLLLNSASRKPQATKNNEIWIKVVNNVHWRLFILVCPIFLNCADLARFLLPHWEDIQDYIRELVLA